MDVKSIIQFEKDNNELFLKNEIENKSQKNIVFRQRANSVKTIIAIGTSTGGPRALNEVIPKLDENIDASILVVQHMPKGFTKSLAQRLNNISKIRVKEAEDGEILENGVCYIAKGGYNMRIVSEIPERYRIVLDSSATNHRHKPSVDIMMESVAKSKIKNVIAVIMTGMGDDGAKGLAMLKDRKNARTISEDEKTCIVYGMPKAAFGTKKVDNVVELGKIADYINKLMGV